ncbi:MAG: polysaccharide biosynthesis tyrosine autokinase [Phycisphaera sp.]|nr:polysaccharide biosynthesis tyrosine autokinase [Phycisphaera sp.]
MTANPLQPISSIPPAATGGQPAMPRFTPVDPMRLLRENLRIFIVAMVVGVFAGGALYVYMNIYKPVYTSVTQLFVSTGPDDPYDQNKPIETRTKDIEFYIRTQIPRLTSNDVLGAVLAKDSIKRMDWFKDIESNSDGVRMLAGSLRADPIEDTSLLVVTLSGPNAADVPTVLTEIVNQFINTVKSDVDFQTRGIRTIFTDEVNRARDAQKVIEEQIERYRVENDVPAFRILNNQDNVVYYELSRQLTMAQLDAQTAKMKYDAIVQQRNATGMSYTPMEMAQIESDPTIVSLDNEAASLRRERGAMIQSGYGEKHPQIGRIDERLRTLEQTRSRAVSQVMQQRINMQIEQARGDWQQALQKVESIANQQKEVHTRLHDMETKLDELRQLEGSLTAAKEREDRAQGLLENLRIKLIRPDSSQIRVYAAPSDAEKTFPKVTSMVPAVTFVVLLLTSGVIYLRELFDQRLKRPQDVRLLPSAELMGVIPSAAEDPSGTTHMEGVVAREPHGLIAEMFRQLRTAILSRMDRRGYKSLLVVSPQAGSGVSTVINNLALSLSHNNRRVLVIDANFRRPSVHRLFEVQPKPGLFEVLEEKASMQEAITHIEGTTIDVLPAGDAHMAPPETLERPSCRALLAEAEGRYDVILIDSPPALVATESQLLAKHVDALVLVVRAMQDKRGMVNRMLRQLDGSRADVLGLVLNDVRSSSAGYFRKSYQEFYDYRSGTSSKATDKKPSTSAA